MENSLNLCLAKNFTYTVYVIIHVLLNVSWYHNICHTQEMTPTADSLTLRLLSTQLEESQAPQTIFHYYYHLLSALLVQ